MSHGGANTGSGVHLESSLASLATKNSSFHMRYPPGARPSAANRALFLHVRSTLEFRFLQTSSRDFMHLLVDFVPLERLKGGTPRGSTCSRTGEGARAAGFGRL